VLTPHPLEASRLLDCTTTEVQADRVGAARELANRFRCVAVLKGSGSVIAARDTVPVINATGNAALASAGTGDVLAGWIGGLWAQRADAALVTGVAGVQGGTGRRERIGGAVRGFVRVAGATIR
jgi:NAD(P)H-hydrate repair Nnr-like enzyme with NAD(P)H-hydrate dehydratase domain